jgi:hypothetical protein
MKEKMKRFGYVVLWTLACGQAWAVHKCTAPDGKVTYQAQACPLVGTGEVLNPGHRTVVLVPNPEGLSPIKPNNQADSFAVAPLPAVPSAGPLDGEAQTCLEFILPMLKDPGSPYVRDVRKEGTVLSMNVYAKNAYGGTTGKAAACEIKNSRLDVGWTNIHLKRLGWFGE